MSAVILLFFSVFLQQVFEFCFVSGAFYHVTSAGPVGDQLKCDNHLFNKSYWYMVGISLPIAPVPPTPALRRLLLFPVVTFVTCFVLPSFGESQQNKSSGFAPSA